MARSEGDRTLSREQTGTRITFLNNTELPLVRKGQGNSGSGKSQGIFEFVREIWHFDESHGHLRKFKEI